MLLGWDPAKALLSLDEVLPANLIEVSFRDDLVDWLGGYLWTSWNSTVVGSALGSTFYSTVSVEPVLDRLKSLAVRRPN